ncbi:unnamed protein product [Amoebophrya sp. A25]|nr:unnamed protein product [Amoebophrya sp. A25]|eukprot:GSA25T00005279001.1
MDAPNNEEDVNNTQEGKTSALELALEAEETPEKNPLEMALEEADAAEQKDGVNGTVPIISSNKKSARVRKTARVEVGSDHDEDEEEDSNSKSRVQFNSAFVTRATVIQEKHSKRRTFLKRYATREALADAKQTADFGDEIDHDDEFDTGEAADHDDHHRSFGHTTTHGSGMELETDSLGPARRTRLRSRTSRTVNNTNEEADAQRPMGPLPRQSLVSTLPSIPDSTSTSTTVGFQLNNESEGTAVSRQHQRTSVDASGSSFAVSAQQRMGRMSQVSVSTSRASTYSENGGMMIGPTRSTQCKA